MHCAIDIAPLGELADPQAIVRLGREAEDAGWDGLSTWDTLGLAMGAEAADPFVALAAVATATERLRLIASVIVLPRRRPHLVAQAAATLDRLSGGRLVLGVGAGADEEDFARFGEDFERAVRIARLDADIVAVDAYLRGVPATLEGVEVPASGARIGPRSAQDPRPPIWLGGMRPGALRRAAAWDGWIAVATSEDGSAMALSPEAFESMVGRVGDARAALGQSAAPFDVAVFGYSDPGGSELVARYAAAGATWWLESLSPMRGSLDDLLALVRKGPPRP